MGSGCDLLREGRALELTGKGERKRVPFKRGRWPVPTRKKITIGNH